VTAAHLQSAFDAGGGALGGLFGYLGGFPGVAAYATALDRLHAEPYLAPVKSVLLGNLGFTDSLMSCPTAASTGVNTFLAEGQCAWAKMGGRVLNVDRTAANIGYQDNTWSASTGAQFALAPSWFGSVAAGYENSDIKVDNRASATGNVFHIGASAKYIKGNWQISSALTGGHARYDVTRLDVIARREREGRPIVELPLRPRAGSLCVRQRHCLHQAAG
jgi:Autotransporter beta-domain